ncbi:hypothetical protein X271_00220 [Candidatus Hepatoplasma crinochetorum Av]|uniref:Uncharacterized protein n=1 Tax=Candidatus Hepatoplasma crinochetorum Av TaxID=1427984 RepID=W8GEW1_9MOLU|nr:hypothetical protein [Candidatus Hepatoplasma crinochetorum]AHK22329.1 hypothetical protein X271_00220 [Candidatus Hepatoplasma crinochetorum Av]
MKEKNNKVNLSNLKFYIFITSSVNNNIFNKFKNWTDKYYKFIEYKRINIKNQYLENYNNFLIDQNDTKYFSNLKRKFKKYINASLKIKEKEIIYLNDNKILDYKYKNSENKIRPYYVSNPNTTSNYKIVLYQISSKERENLIKINLNNNICYLNWEEPITVNKFKLFKIIIEN